MSNIVEKQKTEVVYDREQLELIKKSVCPGHTDDEFGLVLEIAKRSNLDLFSRQYYSVIRTSKKGERQQEMGATIGGLRAIAHRTGDCVGIDEVRFEWPLDRNGKPDRKTNPISATCTVRRLVKGHVAEFTATVHWQEYAINRSATNSWTKHMYAQKPCTMLGKCAQAAAIRMGFPEAGNIYVAEEFEREDQIAEEEQRVQQEPTRQTQVNVFGEADEKDEVAQKILADLAIICEGWDIQRKGDYLRKLARVGSIKELYSLTIENLRELVAVTGSLVEAKKDHESGDTNHEATTA